MLDLKIKFFPLLLAILMGCGNRNSLDNELLSNNNWFDTYGKEYKFENNKINYRFKTGMWWEEAEYYTKNGLLYVTCSQISSDIHEKKAISIDEEKIVFKPSSICEFYDFIDLEKEFVLWKDPKLIIDEGEELEFLQFKAQPNYFYEGIRNFKLTGNKKVETWHRNESDLKIYHLDDSIYNHIKHLIQILPLEEYKETYKFFIMDGVDFDIEIKTNRASKKIQTTGWLPVGLDHLISYIPYVNN